ncbi:hypothetical protein BDW02DRAFT_516053 [Decorospora gaudefroyi]|uniref:Uncharacterized protein n=1 Tax=Decorospora gaudefroyi TaxID=184978 RepID=A0A6A5KK81_9PLEO|nr:hypothetical protein BDW02DRAFT_516053 [Decorospora gaudefroyi]
MPAFPRGLDGFMRQHTFRLPSSLRTALFGTRERFFQPNAIPNTRSFASTALRRYPYPARTVTPKRGVSVLHDPVLRQVNHTGHPVLLYEAPTNKWYYPKVFGLGLLWIGVGAYSIRFNFDLQDNDVPFFVRPTYIFVGLAFIVIGCYTCTAPANRMRTLQVVPSVKGGGMQLRMTVKAAPWSKEQVIYSSLGRATISEKTEPLVQELQEAERFRKQRVWQHLGHLSIPGRAREGTTRWFHQKWINFFLRFKFAVLRFGIAKVRVEEEEWKVDCSGWLLENGQALDRLIPAE